MQKWRVWFISFIFLISLGVIIARLFLIQVVSTRAFSSGHVDLVQLAQESHHREMVVHSGRGMILDRNEKPMVGEKRWRILIFPQSQQELMLRRDALERLSVALHYPSAELRAQLGSLKQPSFLVTSGGREITLDPKVKEELSSIHIPGMFIVDADHRLSQEQVGQSIIGRVARNPFIVKERYPEEVHTGRSQQIRVGISGIESAFDPFLHGREEEVLTYIKDRSGKPLNGLQVKTQQKECGHETPAYTVVTTIDQEIQRKAELILAEEKVDDGAIVVQDTISGDLLALASNPRDMEVEKGKPWDNRCLMEMTPGSIFKVVVAVGGLEEGIVKPNTVFKCTGDLNRYHMKDAHPEGHGTITFANAFAQSCNVVLSQVAEKLGGQRLEEYAKRLGLGQNILWSGKLFKDEKFHQLREQAGIIFSDSSMKKDLGAVAQTGIGQRDVKVTPIQAVNMVTALFHQGRPFSPRVVTEMRGSNGKRVWEFQQKYLQNKPLKASTIRAVRSMMRLVVTEGTAVSMAHARISLAGKTGTAQIGQGRYNKWMIGFGPTLKPRYTVSVVLRSVRDWKDPRANRIFHRMMDGLVGG